MFQSGSRWRAVPLVAAVGLAGVVLAPAAGASGAAGPRAAAPTAGAGGALTDRPAAAPGWTGPSTCTARSTAR